MTLLKKNLTLIFSLNLLLACSGEVKVGLSREPESSTVSKKSAPTKNTWVWDFSTIEDYTFPENYVDITTGKANLKTVEMTHATTDFNSGNHVGTFLDANNNITLKAELHGSLNIKNILPEKNINLIGYWRMDGNMNDSSPLANSGTSNGITYSSEKVVGSKSSHFNGTTDYFEQAYSSDLNPSTFTISSWVKVTGGQGTWRSVVTSRESGPNSGYIIYAGNDNNWQVWTGSSGGWNIVNTNRAVVLNSWTHISTTYDGSDIRIYINGSAVSTLAVPYDLNTTRPLRIGAGTTDGSASFFFDGEIDELAIWNLPLSSSDILNLYQVQSQNYTELSASWTPKYSDIVGYWKMDGDWKDSSGSANHGTAYNGAAFSSSAKVGTQSGKFDGVNDKILLPNTATFYPVSFTINSWIKVNGSSITGNKTDFIFDKGFYGDTGYGIYKNSDNTIKGYIATTQGGAGVTSLRKIDSAWHMVSLNYNHQEQKLRLYIDGYLENEVFANVDISSAITSEVPSIGACAKSDANCSSRFFSGTIDELAFWNSSLNENEVKAIYNHQKQKYVGYYDSPVIDLAASVSWDYLKPTTPLPFLKELLATSESSLEYSLFSGDLSSGLLGYWPLNEVASGSAPGATDFEDRSGNTLHASQTGGVAIGSNGLLLSSTSFDGIDDNINLGDILDMGTNDMTLSAWINTSYSGATSQYFISKSIAAGANSRYALGLASCRVRIFFNADGTNFTTGAESNICDGKWHHIVGIFDRDGDMQVYVDGALDLQVDISSKNGLDLQSSFPFMIGSYTNSTNTAPSLFFNGRLDEIAIWNRALTPTETAQLYRRGANRIKYQVKSCVDSNCNCKSFSTSPIGSTNDCDGDGTLNNTDTSDSYMAQWLGKDGATGESFSELQSCSTVDGTTTGDCTGSVNETSPNFLFANFPLAAQAENNRYFQYRVLMEAEENTACAGSTTCLPELSSIEFGPTGSYFAGSPEISPSSSSLTYTDITSITFTETGTCTITYQLSNDGTNYKYWSGSNWVNASGSAQSSNAAIISSQISSFSSEVGAGTLYWKAFLGSNGSQDCSIEEISVSVEN